VETIGDAYLVASGVPTRNGNRHAPEIANFSLQILEFVEHYKIPGFPNTQLQIRVGIHTGLSVCLSVEQRYHYRLDVFWSKREISEIEYGRPSVL